MFGSIYGIETAFAFAINPLFCECFQESDSCLAVYEGPDFIALYTAYAQTANCRVVIRGTDTSRIFYSLSTVCFPTPSIRHVAMIEFSSIRAARTCARFVCLVDSSSFNLGNYRQYTGKYRVLNYLYIDFL